MNVLIVGAGAGSFEIRGRQLGEALHARVDTSVGPHLRWADIVVLVKRAGWAFARQVRDAGKPLVWDALDFWTQPGDNDRSPADARALLGQKLQDVQPDLTIGATESMARDCGGVCLPHHAWPYLAQPRTPRATVQVVAYEGSERYLGAWGARLRAACEKRGWLFVVNPPDLRDADLLVAFRDAPWDGWMCQEWKSGVKVVNAIAAGRPLMHQPSAAARELPVDGAVVECAADIDGALDCWTSLAARQGAFERARIHAPRFSLSAIAARYHVLLAGVAERAVA